MTLTEEVLSYQETGKGWKDLSDRIFLYAYRFPARISDWDEDKCSEFFLSFHSRIPNIVERFRPDYPFETYLGCCLRWHMKTFNEVRACRENYDAWWTDPLRADYDGCGAIAQPAVEEEVCSILDNPPAEFGEGPFRTDEQGRIADRAVRRRILYAAMLGAADLDTREIEKLSVLLDVNPDTLFTRVREIRETVAWKIENRERLRQRRNEYWYRLDDASRHVRSEEVREGNRYREWKRKEQTWEKRYRSAAKHLRTTRVRPSHKDIAEVLGVPAGSVSSGLHLLRKAWEQEEARGLASGGMTGYSSGHGNPAGHGQRPQERRTGTHPVTPPHHSSPGHRS